jgi:spore coat polysaccharide biosynthesis predicted glycosyltransferase SpsG
VVTGGGVTPIEAVSLGVVPVILILADNQKSGAEYLAAAGVARSLEIGDCAMIEAARSALDLLSNDVDRSTMVARGRAMVDGIGPMRLVEALFKEME